MTVVTVVWLAGLVLALILLDAWNASGAPASVKKAATWIVATGVVLWALLLFRTLGAFGEIHLP